MNHGKKIKHLSRTKSHRAALMMNLSLALIQHKRIFTTVAKAKSLRRYIEPLVTKAKSNTTHNRRVVFSHLNNKEAVTELFSTIAGKIGDRPGGYTRVIRTGFRKGDGAEMAMIELVDFNEVYINPKGKRSEKASAAPTGVRRTRRKKSKSAAAPAAAATKSASGEEE